MEKRNKIIELFLGMIFIVLLIFVVVFLLYFPDFSQQKPNSQTVVQTATSTTTNVVNNYYTSQIIYQTTKVFNPETEWRDRDYKEYSSYGQHTKEKTFFNNYRDEFDVYVVNNLYETRYFKVYFKFCDYYDNCFVETIEKYVPAREEVRFVYLDIQSEQYKYNNWEYSIEIN